MGTPYSYPRNAAGGKRDKSPLLNHAANPVAMARHVQASASRGTWQDLRKGNTAPASTNTRPSTQQADACRMLLVPSGTLTRILSTVYTTPTSSRTASEVTWAPSIRQATMSAHQSQDRYATRRSNFGGKKASKVALLLLISMMVTART